MRVYQFKNKKKKKGNNKNRNILCVGRYILSIECITILHTISTQNIPFCNNDTK